MDIMIFFIDEFHTMSIFASLQAKETT